MNINKDRKIELQKKVINDLQEQNRKLIEENEELKTQLELEKIKPQEGYEKAKKLMIELEEYKKKYEELIVGLKEKQRMCDNQLIALRGIQAEYKKRMDELIDVTSKTNKQITKNKQKKRKKK